MTETLEKTLEKVSEEVNESKEKWQEEVYKEMQEQIQTEEVARIIATTVTKIKEENGPLSRFLRDFINAKAETEEQEKNLLLGMAQGIVSYMYFQEISRIAAERESAKFIIKNLTLCGTMVKAVKGEQIALTVIPPKLIDKEKLDTNEKIVEFAKKLPPFQEFETLEGVEFKILTDEEMQKELDFIKEKMSAQEEVEETNEEAKECQK